MIHRLCRVKLPGGFAPIGLSSTRLCTDQFIRAGLRDKIQRIASRLDRNCARLDKRGFSMQKHTDQSNAGSGYWHRGSNYR